MYSNILNFLIKLLFPFSFSNICLLLSGFLTILRQAPKGSSLIFPSSTADGSPSPEFVFSGFLASLYPLVTNMSSHNGIEPQICRAFSAVPFSTAHQVSRSSPDHSDLTSHRSPCLPLVFSWAEQDRNRVFPMDGNGESGWSPSEIL